MGLVPENGVGLQDLRHRVDPAAEVGSCFVGIGAQERQGPTIAATLLTLQVPRAAFRKRLTAENAAHAPRIDIRPQASVLGQPNRFGNAALVKAMIVFREGEDDVGKTKTGNIVKVTSKMLRIADPEITDAPLPTGRIKGGSHAAARPNPAGAPPAYDRLLVMVLSSEFRECSRGMTSVCPALIR